jgi:hypothetical protein
LPSPPPPIQVNGVEEYEVDYIKNSRKQWNHIEFLVHWKGYPDEDDTWEPRKNITNVQAAIDDFYDKHPKSPR